MPSWHKNAPQSAWKDHGKNVQDVNLISKLIYYLQIKHSCGKWMKMARLWMIYLYIEDGDLLFMLNYQRVMRDGTLLSWRWLCLRCWQNTKVWQLYSQRAKTCCTPKSISYLIISFPTWPKDIFGGMPDWINKPISLQGGVSHSTSTSSPFLLRKAV